MIIFNLITMNRTSSGYYIGIDSGGTKCELVISSPDGKIIFSKKYKGIHYSVAGADVYSETVSGFITDAVRKCGLELKKCHGICLGIAGAREKKDRNRLRKLFSQKLKLRNIIISSDALTALFGAFGGEEGIILISGTGSVLYGYTENKIIRVGGWGRIFADEGSGYWIGKRALNLITKEYDEIRAGKKRSLLSQVLEEKYGITKKNLNEKIFRGNFLIQNIAPLVIECAGMNCPLSRIIADETAEALLEHIKSFLRISGRKKKIKIAFIGSIIENKNLISDKLKKEIDRLKTVEVVTKEHPPAFGAVLLAMGNSDLPSKL